MTLELVNCAEPRPHESLTATASAGDTRAFASCTLRTKMQAAVASPGNVIFKAALRMLYRSDPETNM